MTMVNDINGKAIDFEAAMALADPEICEDENDTFFAAVSAGLAAAKFNGQEVEQ